MFTKTKILLNEIKPSPAIISILDDQKMVTLLQCRLEPLHRIEYASTLERQMNGTYNALNRNALFGAYAPFTKVFIIRGIGYQADLIDIPTDTVGNEFFSNRYLYLRVGHSYHFYKPIPTGLGVSISYKDRKLVIYGNEKQHVANFAQVIFKSRPPSVYTGRGIRRKKEACRRKLGKKDVRKGKT